MQLGPSVPVRFELSDRSELPAAIRLICEWDSEYFYYGYPWSDVRLMIRAFLDATRTDEPVVMDFTELVHGGYYSGDEQLATLARESARSQFISCAPIIVLCEGSTDVEFLSKSLALLHPDVAPLYSFLDFQIPSLEGGVGNLVRILKSFIGSGIANRVIALFDNDTAGHDAIRSIGSIPIPENFAILTYPEIDYAKSYPTHGPTGLTNADVNNLAGGIELYFGTDILQDADGKFTPVQWKGYNSTLQKYQGELLNKRALQDAFRNKLKQADESADWTSMQAIFTVLFNAFDQVSFQI